MQQLHGIPKVVAQDESIIRELYHQGSKASSPLLAAGKRNNPGVNNPKLAAINKYLSAIASALGVEVVYVMDASGYCIASSNAGKADSFVGSDFGQRDYFKMARSQGTGQHYVVGSVSQTPGFYFSSSIVMNGQFIGVAAAKLNLSSLGNWVNQPDEFVSDKFGIIILSGDKSLEMRSISERRISELTEVERWARYQRKDFPSLIVKQ